MPHIHSLPSEVLAHIFELGTASPENDFGQDGFPALVSLVCRAWRTLALDTPTLWNNLTLDGDERPPFAKTRTQIARSKGTPLNIYLDFSARADPAMVQEVMKVLLPELARWRHLIIVVPDFDVMYSAAGTIADAFKSPRTVAPYLEVLRLYGPPEFDPTQPEPRNLPLPIPLFGLDHADPDEEDEFDPTPRLRDVVVCGVPVDWATFLPTNLEKLQLSLHSGSRQPTFDQFARLITTSPKLHTLILNASGPKLDPPGPSLQLPYLKSLTIDCFDPEYVERLLGRVCTPLLESLALADSSGDSSRVFEMLAIGRGHTDPVGRSVGIGMGAGTSVSMGVFGSTMSFGGSTLALPSTLAFPTASTLAFPNTFSGSTLALPLPGSITQQALGSTSSLSSTSSHAAFPRLTTLKISSVECTPAAFRQLVRGLPNLTSVNLDARDADPEILCTLGDDEEEEDGEGGEQEQMQEQEEYSPDPDPAAEPERQRRLSMERICPHLRTITCTGVPGSVIKDLVARRLRARVPIRTVRFAMGEGVELSPEDREWLERHVELEFFEEDEDEEVDGGAWWSTWD